MDRIGLISQKKNELPSSITKIELQWMPLPNAAEMAHSESGVYWLGAPFNIQYADSISRVFYIGSSVNLRKRLLSHANKKDRGNLLLESIAFPDPSKILCSYYPWPGLNEADVRGLEREIIYRFGVEHGYIPHGNRIPPDNESEIVWEGKVLVIEPAINGDFLNADDIAERFDLIADKDTYSVYTSLTFDLSEGTAETGPKILSVNFRKPPSTEKGRRPRKRISGERPAKEIVVEKPYDARIKIPKDEVERNFEGQRLENEGLFENAIECYLANVGACFEGDYPYDRLAIIYRKRKQYNKEVEILAKAIWVFENKVHSARGDRIPKLAKFRKRLKKALELRDNVYQLAQLTHNHN